MSLRNRSSSESRSRRRRLESGSRAPRGDQSSSSEYAEEEIQEILERSDSENSRHSDIQNIQNKISTVQNTQNISDSDSDSVGVDSATANEISSRRLDKKRAKLTEIDDRRARHIFRVANQKEARRKNPPPKKPKLLKCNLCNIYCNSSAQLHVHNHSKAHRKSLTRKADKLANTHCYTCNRELGNKHDYEAHLRSEAHRIAHKRRRLE